MFRHADVVCLCLVCILWQFSMLHDFQFVNNNNNIYLKSDIHKMFNRLYIKTYTNNITEIHV